MNIFALSAIEDVTGSLPFAESKASQLMAIGECWAMEDGARNEALSLLASLPVADCLRLAAEAEGRARDLEVGAAARRERGEKEPKPYQMVGSTAIIPVRGTMTKKPSSFGGASTITTARLVRSAEKDPDVARTLMIFETPGGECRGCAELADQIRESNAAKPIYGYVDDLCASAGYFAASQCSAIYMNRMGFAGCIGTLAVLYDMSANAAMQGVKVLTFKSSGAETYKGLGVEGTEITPEQRAHYQSIVDHYGNDFKATVQAGRGFTDEQVSKVADGRLYNAEDAMGLGLIDGVLSLEECLEQISALAEPTHAAPAANDPARATSAATKDKQMKLTKDAFMALFRKVDKATLAGSGLEDVEDIDVPEAVSPAPVAVIDPAIVARMDALEERNVRLENRQLDEAALSFWNELITPDEDGRALAKWSQKPGVIATFKALAITEGGRPSFDASDKLIVPEALGAYMTSMREGARNALQAELIQGAEPKGRFGADKEALKQVLGGTSAATQEEE